MMNQEEVITQIHRNVATILFEQDIIKFLSQVAIIEYQYKEDKNKYISVLTDVFDPYSLFLFNDSDITNVKDAKTEINEFVQNCLSVTAFDDQYHETLRNIEHCEILEEKINLSFNLLKEVVFHKPTTSQYFQKIIDRVKTDRLPLTSFIHCDDINDVEKKSLRRESLTDWKLGGVIEVLLLHRQDAPIYTNAFFSLDGNRLFAVLAFLQGRHKNKFTKLMEHHLPSIIQNCNVENKVSEFFSKYKKPMVDKETIKKLNEIDKTLEKLSVGESSFKGHIADYIATLRNNIERMIPGVEDERKVSVLLDKFKENPTPAANEIEDILKSLDQL